MVNFVDYSGLKTVNFISKNPVVMKVNISGALLTVSCPVITVMMLIIIRRIVNEFNSKRKKNAFIRILYSCKLFIFPYDFIVNISEEWSRISSYKGTFLEASRGCNLKYSLSNYKPLFGLINDKSDKLKTKYWLGNFRGEDNTENKGMYYTKSCVLALKYFQCEHQCNSVVQHCSLTEGKTWLHHSQYK